jgi:tRNA1(Val) A37 N6-methylase TrmN6
LTLIHRVEALSELLAALDGRFGAVAIRPLAARDGAPATRVIVSGKKGSRAPLRLLAPLVLHDADGGYSTRVRSIIEDAAALA